MEREPEDSPQPLSQKRQKTIDALCEHFANDALEVDEFERRVEAAHRAATPADLEGLLRDLPGENLPAGTVRRPAAEARPRGYSVTSSARVKEREIVVAIMGGASRRGKWSPARRNFAFAVMGGAELDFREAVLGPGVTEVQVFAMWGGIEIIVPPGLNVESHGIGIMGGFDHFTEQAPDDGAPTLRITGFACMGGVEITQRYAGESSRDARRRRRAQHRGRLGPGEADGEE